LHKALLTYDLSIRAVKGTHTAAQHTSVISPVEVREGASHTFEGVHPVEVVIHYDGRDHVELPVGVIKDYYWTVPITYNFEIGEKYTNPKMYKWPSSKAPNNDQETVGYITRDFDSQGNTYRIFYRIQRQGLLYD